jgi:hypothetical protein
VGSLVPRERAGLYRLESLFGLLVPTLALPLLVTLLASSSGAPRLVPEERMEFAIDYKGIRLGKAQVFLGRADGSVIPVFLQTRTTGLASIITIRQHLSSNIDRETGLPRSSSLEAIEGDYRHRDTTAFNRAENTATVYKRGKHENTQVVNVPPGTLDFLAMVFRLRQLPLEPGSRHAFDVLAGRTVSHVETEVVGRERVSSGVGDVEAVKVRVPTSFEGEFQEKNPTFIWFTDDSRRIIVRISVEFAIGRATATLASYTPGKTG